MIACDRNYLIVRQGVEPILAMSAALIRMSLEEARVASGSTCPSCKLCRYSSEQTADDMVFMKK